MTLSTEWLHAENKSVSPHHLHHPPSPSPPSPLTEPHPPQMSVRRSTRLRTRQGKRISWSVVEGEEEEEEGGEGEMVREVVLKPPGDPKKM